MHVPVCMCVHAKRCDAGPLCTRTCVHVSVCMCVHAEHDDAGPLRTRTCVHVSVCMCVHAECCDAGPHSASRFVEAQLQQEMLSGFTTWSKQHMARVDALSACYQGTGGKLLVCMCVYVCVCVCLCVCVCVCVLVCSCAYDVLFREHRGQAAGVCMCVCLSVFVAMRFF